MTIFTNFIDGLKKSFSGKQYLRDLNKCERCGKPSFFKWCLYCETEFRYKDDAKND